MLDILELTKDLTGIVFLMHFQSIRIILCGRSFHRDLHSIYIYFSGYLVSPCLLRPIFLPYNCWHLKILYRTIGAKNTMKKWQIWPFLMLLKVLVFNPYFRTQVAVKKGMLVQLFFLLFPFIFPSFSPHFLLPFSYEIPVK